MTTHCASRYQKILKQVAPQICIVEEAAEVNSFQFINTQKTKLLI